MLTPKRSPGRRGAASAAKELRTAINVRVPPPWLRLLNNVRDGLQLPPGREASLSDAVRQLLAEALVARKLIATTDVRSAA